jgi:glycosyltransferase involved in cell wall biosynthesis
MGMNFLQKPLISIIKKDMTKVSVIIPAFNASQFIAQAIESVLDQTFTDRELIVVDDGSTDDTASIVMRYGDKLRYIYQKNQGLSSARNTGIDRAEGELIALLDADDFWDREKLTYQVALCDSSPDIGVVYTALKVVDNDGHEIEERRCLLRGQLFSSFLNENCVAPSSSMIKRECFEKVGTFDESLSASEDWDLWLRIAPHYLFDFVDLPLTFYRIHPGSMHKDLALMERNVFQVLDKLFKREALNQEVWQRRGEILSKHSLDFALNYYIQRNFKNTRRCIFSAWKWDKKEINLFHLTMFLKTLLGKRVINNLSKKKEALKKGQPLL